MKAASWSRLGLLAGAVVVAHGWVLEVGDPPPVRAAAVPVPVPEQVSMQARPAPVMVMSNVMPATDLDGPRLAQLVRSDETAALRPAQVRIAPWAAPTKPTRPVAPSLMSAIAKLEPAALPVALTRLSATEPETRADLPEPTEPIAPTEPAPPAAAEPAAERLAQAGLAAKPAAAEPAAPRPPDPPVPTYRTRPPAAAKLNYRLSRGQIVGSGTIDWRPAAGSYSLQLEGSVPILGTLITQTSRGRLDATGLAPERHTDRRMRRGEQAANFDRAAARISFSGQAPELPLTPGAQDRLSVMLQLPAIANAWSRMPPVGEHVLIRVVGARGDSNVWSLRFEGLQTLELEDGRVNTLRFLRESDGPNDTRAEFWLDPARQHLPVKMLLTDGKGDALELLRIP